MQDQGDTMSDEVDVAETLHVPPRPAPAQQAMDIVSLKALRQQPQQGEMPFAIVQGKPLTEF